MPSVLPLVLLLATASLSQAHIEFIRTAHNGVWQEPLKYIRNRTAPYQEAGEAYPSEWTFPVNIDHAPMSVRCGRDSLTWAPETDTLKVKPGDEIEFQPSNAPPYMWNNASEIQWDGCADGKGGCIAEGNYGSYYHFGIAHEGPASIYLSPVPEGTEIEKYDGSGEWVKIFTLGTEFRKDEAGSVIFWLPVHDRKMSAVIPRQTPPGKYLLRIHQVWPSTQHSTKAQIYPACAHIEVTADPETKPNVLPKGIKIPEDMCADCPGMNYEWGSAKNWVELLNGTEYGAGGIWDGEKLTPDVVVPLIKEW